MADSSEKDSVRGPAAHARSARRAVFGALAAELGHDLQGPLNLFRLMTERVESGETLDAEDASLLREELERLRGLSARLRELARTSPRRAECSALEVARAALALPPAIDPTTLEVELGAAEALRLSCELPLVAQALRELLDNALEARQERAGLRFEAGERPGFCVWDDGPGFALSPSAAMRFGQSTRDGAAGLGLTLALRAARAHGYRLELGRTDVHTEARLVFVPDGGSASGSQGPR
jgi:signal transduction histidine kinase